MSILDNVQRVLKLYASGISDLSFTEAATMLSLPKGSASHLLAQMVRYGLLDQHPVTRRYRAGALLAQATQAAYAGTPLDDACRQVLEQLSQRSGLTAYLSTLDGVDTVVLQRLNGASPVQVLASPGSRRAAFSTAMGRALLSRLGTTEFDRAFGVNLQAPLEGATQPDLQTVGDLDARLARAREERHAVAVDEAMPGIGAVAAAVRDPKDGSLRGLCVSFVAGLPGVEDRLDVLKRLVVDEVSALGQRMGDSFWLPEHVRNLPATRTRRSRAPSA